MKKYCSHCVYLKREADFLTIGYYNSIAFRNDKDKDAQKKISCDTPICTSNLVRTLVVLETPLRRDVKYDLIVDNPLELNKNFDCKYYKENFFFKFLAKLRKKEVQLKANLQVLI